MMSAIFGGYRTQVYHEVVQRIAMALKGKVSDDSQAALVPLPEDTKVTRVLKNVPGLVDMAIPDDTDHQYMRHVTVKRPKRNAVRFTVIRESSRNEHSYVIRSFQEGRA
jgi:hypothetical protein